MKGRNVAVRRTYFDDRSVKIFSTLNKQIQKIWLLWVIGILIGAIGIKPTGFSSAGVSFTFDHPEAIQGVIFLACLLQTYAASFQIMSRNMPFRRIDVLRSYIWRRLPRGTRSLANLSQTRRLAIKISIRNNCFIFYFSVVFTAVLPAALILLFSGSSLISAIKLIAGSYGIHTS